MRAIGVEVELILPLRISPLLGVLFRLCSFHYYVLWLISCPMSSRAECLDLPVLTQVETLARGLNTLLFGQNADSLPYPLNIRANEVATRGQGWSQPARRLMLMAHGDPIPEALATITMSPVLVHGMLDLGADLCGRWC